MQGDLAVHQYANTGSPSRASLVGICRDLYEACVISDGSGCSAQHLAITAVDPTSRSAMHFTFF